MVGEHPDVGRSLFVRTGGRIGRENAGMSSESVVRICAVENLRFPGGGSSAQGKPGPKARPRGVVEGCGVKIPRPEVADKKGAWTRQSRETGQQEETGPTA